MQSKKIFSILLLAALIVQGTFGLISPAHALFGVSIPTPSQVADQFEKRYNLNLESIQDQAQLLNVADKKQMAPEVSIIFDPSDPRPGQKLTAKAFPLYFNGPQEQLYYVWYLQRAGCGLDGNPSDAKRNLCDENGDRDITVEDWKIAAMGELARNGYSNEGVDYSTDSDSDGYRARFGGSTRVNTENHCYFHDNQSGEDYEIADSADTNFTCPAGKDAVCIASDQVVESGQVPASTAGTNVESNVFNASGGSACFISGSPICKKDGSVSCSVGEPRCINRESQNDCGQTLTTCDTTSEASANPICRHLFPNAPGQESGDGTFSTDEERFWRTDPRDDSTADNGNKDEANIVGLGQANFTWNYIAGDQVGVVVEGSSTLPTKHDDSSYKIMWAFSKNDCSLSEAQGTGSYTKDIKNYQVIFPTANIDLNRCLEKNLVDPTQGGQSTNLNLQMVVSPENPMNDETTDRSGDILTVQTLVDNGQKGPSGQLFDWRVELSNNPQFNNALGRVADVTEALTTAGLLKQTKGTALDTIDISLNMGREMNLAGRPLSDYLSGDQGFLRISARVSENFASGIVRKGRTDTIVTFSSTKNKIIAYKAKPILAGNKMRVELPDDEGIICQDARLDRTICRVLQNEIIGLKIDNDGLSNFQWTINGAPLSCTPSSVSADCDNEQNEINFFPVDGGVGSSYTVGVTATDITSGKTVVLSRLFQVVEPSVELLSADATTITPKFLGQYRDIRGDAGGCTGGYCNNYSKEVLEGISGEVLKMKALFIPSFLGKTSEVQWSVNGKTVSTTDPTELSIDASNTQPGQVVNVSLQALTTQDDNTRRALIDTWGISQLESGEQRFDREVQVEMVQGAEKIGDVAGVQKYLAALGTYIPETVLYTLGMFLSGALVLFVAAMAFVFLPGEVAPASSNRRTEE